MISEAIAVAVITGIITLIGNILALKANFNKTQSDMIKAQAITDTKLDELTREVRNQKEFATKIPVLEEKINTVSHRVDEIEKKSA